MEVAARPASLDDLPTLSLLATEAIEELTPNRGGAVWSRAQARRVPPDESLLADLGNDDCHIVIGTIDDTPVGYSVITATELPDGSLLGVISDLFTLEGARGVSVGEEMMNAQLEWARAAGCFGVDSLALPGDRHTKNFFESFGLVARALTVHRRLVDE